MDSGLRALPDGGAPLNILIVKLSAIGDVVHCLAFLDVLRQNFPRARIDWVVEEGAAAIIEGHPFIGRVIVSRRKSWQRRLSVRSGYRAVFHEVHAFIRALRTVRYDWVIDLQGLFKSGLVTGLSKGARKVGMGGAREGASLFLKEPPVPVNYQQHAMDRDLDIAAYLGCKWDRWNNRIFLDTANRNAVDLLMNRNQLRGQDLVAINPMAKWKTKLWDPTLFAELADRIIKEYRCGVVFTGSRDDQTVIADIMRQMRNRPLSLAGRTGLKELAGLYERCRVLVTTDTGPMHMAAAMGCPVVALFGPTSPIRTGPYGLNHRVLTSAAPCSPCFKKACDHWTCMTDITVENVLNAVDEYLKT